MSFAITTLWAFEEFQFDLSYDGFETVSNPFPYIHRTLI